MDKQNPFVMPEPNSKIHVQHRREVFWQITLPLLIGIILVLAALAGILFVASGYLGGLERWADVSLIWLIIPTLFFAFLFLILLTGIVYAISMLLRVTPYYSHRVQFYFELGREKVNQVSNQVVEPFLRGKSIWAVLRHPGRWAKHQTGGQ